MRRKGITAIISIVLMLLLLVAVFGGVYMWITKFQKKTQEQVSSGAGAATSKATGSVKYMFSVVSIADDGSGNVQITLKNDGNTEIRQQDASNLIVKLDGRVVGSTVANATALTGGNTNWEPGELLQFILNGVTWNDINDGRQHVFYFELSNLGSSISFNCGPLDVGDTAC